MAKIDEIPPARLILRLLSMNYIPANAVCRKCFMYSLRSALAQRLCIKTEFATGVPDTNAAHNHR